MKVDLIKVHFCLLIFVSSQFSQVLFFFSFFVSTNLFFLKIWLLTTKTDEPKWSVIFNVLLFNKSDASDLLNNKTLKITDHLGSSVFVVKSQIFKKNKFVETKKEKKKSTCENCEDTKIKRQKCTLIRSTFNETNNISATSRKLGVSRTTIYKHLQ